MPLKICKCSKTPRTQKNDFRGPANIYGPVVSHRHIIKKPIPETSVELQSPEVTGSLDWHVIARVVKHYSRQLRACYTKELAKTKDLEGTATITWNITKDGNVSSAVLKESTLNNKNMESCLINSIKFWRFPAPKGGGMAKVEFPISFTCESAEYYHAHPNEKTKPKPDLGSI